MLDVHHKGKAVVSSGNREKAEIDVSASTPTACGPPCSATRRVSWAVVALHSAATAPTGSTSSSRPARRPS